MTDANIFTVTTDDLGRLIAKGAVSFVADLLWAEARRLGVPITSVSVSSRIDVPDGGIDADVQGAPSESDLIRKGRTAYQIKAGDFAPWQEAQIRKELFGDKAPSNQSLGPAVKACMDADGTYVLVCTGIDLTPQQRDSAIGFVQRYLNGCGYENAKVEVLSQNQLIGLLKVLPSLSLAVNGHGNIGFQTIWSWAEQDQMRMPFKVGKPQQEFLETIRDGLRTNVDSVHIHVWGEPGVGKTRLVLEALRAHDLAPLIVYCDGPHQIKSSLLLNEILKDDNAFALVLVVDECDSKSRAHLWDKLKHRGPRIKLVSIYNEFDDASGNTALLVAPLLDNAQITQILQEYVPATERADRWAEFCNGSPRVAHVIGGNLKNNPDDLLKPPDTVNIWERYIAGNDDPATPVAQQRRLVLQHIALFKRFGYGGDLVVEAKVIAQMVQAADPNITWVRFQQIVGELKKARILQGETTLYITPKLLHIKLWVDWWDTYENGFDFAAFSEGLSPQLLDWFFEMFQYAAESKAALGIVKQLLDENGAFQGTDFLKDPRGARFFHKLTEASPEAALRCLKKTVGTWTKDELLAFTTRRDVVWALEKIAVWRELFPDAARLLLQLAETENERWANNATGVFGELFTPAEAPVAPTEASPEERFPVLKEALESDSPERRQIALKACEHALETGMFSRTSGAEQQGLKRPPQLWSPKTWGELFDAYRRVWHLLRERLDSMPVDEQQKAVDILIRHARGLAHMANLTPMVIDTIGELLTKPYVDRKRVIALVEDVLHYDAKEFEAERREPWEKLKASLVTDDFHSQIERFVAMELLEDSFDQEGKQVDKVGPKIDSLAEQVIQDPKLLTLELGWLVTDSAKNGYRFGYSLGTRDAGFSLLSQLLGAVRAAGEKATAYFLGGYFRAIFEKAPQEWEQRLDDCVADASLKKHVPELTWRSGITDRAALRILTLAQNGEAGAHAFRMFSYGSVLRNVSKDVFDQWIKFLVQHGDREGAGIAVDLYHWYYFRPDSLAKPSKDLTLSLLTAEPFFASTEKLYRQRDDYDWTEVALGFVRQDPQDSIVLADKMLEHFGEDGTPLGGFHPQARKVLEEITRLFPNEVWQKIAGHLGPPIDSRAFRMKNWLREGGLSLIPAEAVWNWIDENVEKRAWYAAMFVPAVFPGDASHCSAREILVRYGSRKDVKTNLWANFSTEVWWGPESGHYAGKLKWLKQLREGEQNPNVLDWIDEYINSVQHQLEQSRIQEEREDR